MARPIRLHPFTLSLLALVVSLVALAVCSSGAGAYTLPRPNAQFDYQIGGAYRPRATVGVLSRDRYAAPVRGIYNVCYVNAFQTQPDVAGQQGGARWWRRRHDGLLLKKNGRYVVDGEWNEILLDTSTDAKRRALIAVIGPWIDSCADDGFQAIEPDNLDSWTRSRSKLTKADNRAFATLLARRAHAAGVAIAQKNTTELAPVGRAIGFDFAIAEECQVWEECDDYTDVYGALVYEIEYDDNDEDPGGRSVAPISFFNAACTARGSRISVIYRDRMVLARGAAGYAYRWC
ncbi:endo alpha-1,4 polygalactosaminidase [Conexibacter stalactiti]|uniref:Endo alpha-1,4 polygalactosaminidase n=1 Tax=Conexibacter stalactiti TaxID=1940611 RepID=A0ABU4HRL2_9ACTN|nr:endo alpha-1,4 polygalactosaminidase [Conexibacter stalactiti]MDW5595342.1 endo alpha-1,4 polygalactosaminidase [Conexibacter stalactiti]MEC5035984.1 endo alpha-1,4 polygalactosaminidase [Conexibacter stalactiti]